MNNNYVRVRVSGKNPKLFFKINILGKILYRNFKEINNKEIELDIIFKDYIRLKNIRSSYIISIVNYNGLHKIKNIFLENSALLIAVILSLVFLYFLSNICFSIDIVHNDKKIRTLIKSELERNCIKKIDFIPSYDKRKKVIELIIKENKDNIEWLEIERKGSKLIVKVTQRKQNINNDNFNSRHIIAKKSGIIKKVEASSGVILKKKNDYVNKGDIIVSGDIIKDETIKGQVVSNGKVYAEVWYKATVSYPLYYEETLYLNQIKQNIIIEFLGKKYQFRKNYVDSYLEKKKILIEDKIFPIKISLCKQRKIKKNKQKLTKDEAIRKAVSMANNKLNVKLDEDEYIIDKKALNYTLNESTIIIDVFFKVYENITDYKDTDEILKEES